VSNVSMSSSTVAHRSARLNRGERLQPLASRQIPHPLRSISGFSQAFNSRRYRAHFPQQLLASLLLGFVVFMGAPRSLVAQRLDSDPSLAPVTDKSDKPARFTSKDRLRFYWHSTFTPFASVGPVAGSALTQWTTGNPPEWGQGFPGYGRRLLSGYSRQAIANTIGLGVSAVAHEDPRHYPTGEHGVWRRGLFAARQAFVSHNPSGGLMPAYSRIIGAYGAGFVSNAWYPPHSSNIHSALYRGSTALASDIIWQEFKEFWPDARRRFHFLRKLKQ
jgi:hypothetical protein